MSKYMMTKYELTVCTSFAILNFLWLTLLGSGFAIAFVMAILQYTLWTITFYQLRKYSKRYDGIWHKY